ncbi:hypothetical protein V8Q34_22485 [Blautia sp. JLR.GB0024]|uniref:hypothetical protein n=1 Tax=Blautia sp. JLR.GB0024 TaxID=3123295 RepID=UPI003003CE62
MVHLIENYYALTNNMGFTLAVDKGKTDKDGNKIYDTVGYCGSFEETISLLRRKVVDQRLQNGSYELSEALAVIENVKEEIKAAITNESNQ